MKIKMLTCLAAGAVLLSANAAQAQGKLQFYIGALYSTAANYCPTDMLPADGRQLSIAQNSALFTLLGVSYGGNGTTNFNLPDLRGRNAIGAGQGPNLPNFQLGASGGATSVVQTIQQMAAHNHPADLVAANAPPTVDNPAGAAIADFPDGTPIYASQYAPNTAMAKGSVEVYPVGGEQPMAVLDPYLAVTYCIVASGIFPPRQ